MLRLEVNIAAAGALSGLAAISAAMEDRVSLHQNMAAGVEATVAGHLLDLNSRSPNTSFYGRASRSTEVSADEQGAAVLVTHRGIALRFYGGRVLPVNAKNLALPTDDVPMAGTEGRKRPGEMGTLAYIPKRGWDVSATTGYLVEGEEVTIKRGPRKGGKRIAPKKDGKLLYVLRAWTDHDADETVLPSMAVLLQSATDAAADYIDAFSQEGGAA